MATRAINDFTIRVATVNGSGSQSSNLVITNSSTKFEQQFRTHALTA